MTFEDAIAYSRNVVAAKVALGLGENTRESSAILHDDVDAARASASQTGHRRRRRGPRPRQRPDDHAVAARSTSPTARSARASR